MNITNTDEVYKLLDNSEIVSLRGEMNVDPSVSKFINLIFRGNTGKNESQKATHEDIFRLLASTELQSYIDEYFESYYVSKNSLIPDNYWVDTYVRLSTNEQIVRDMIFFNRKLYGLRDQTDLLLFLTEIWGNHRNIVYRLSAVILLHLIGMKYLKENLS